MSDVVPPGASDTQALSSCRRPQRADPQPGRGFGVGAGLPPRPARLVRRRAGGLAVVSGAAAAGIADGLAGLGHYAAIAGVVALFSLAVAAPTAVLARIRPPLVAVAVLAFIVAGIPASGGPANLARFTPGFLRALSPVLP